MNRHVKVLEAVRSAFEGIPAPCDEREALDAAIALMRGQSEDAEARNEAYDRVDHYLRNSLMDAAYAEYSEALDIACGYAAPPKDSADEQ